LATLSLLLPLLVLSTPASLLDGLVAAAAAAASLLLGPVLPLLLL
jgi:hypothetical protein